jgi:Fe-S cluster assembly scaffold protein SufB
MPAWDFRLNAVVRFWGYAALRGLAVALGPGVGHGASMEWVDGNIGSKVTMKYPAVYLMGEHARGETLSVAFAGEGQHQDAGAKMVHCAPNTSSTIVSKSVARGGGRTSYRGLVQVQEGAAHSKSTVKCDALLIDTVSRSDTYPYVDVREAAGRGGGGRRRCWHGRPAAGW